MSSVQVVKMVRFVEVVGDVLKNLKLKTIFELKKKEEKMDEKKANDNKRKRAVVCAKSYYLEEGIWNDIKEYAGIYNIKIDWDSQKRFARFRTVLFDGILSYEKRNSTRWENYWKIFRGLKSKKHGSIKERINIAKKRFFEFNVKNSWKKETFQYISDNLNLIKKKPTPPPTPTLAPPTIVPIIQFNNLGGLHFGNIFG